MQSKTLNPFFFNFMWLSHDKLVLNAIPEIKLGRNWEQKCYEYMQS